MFFDQFLTPSMMTILWAGILAFSIFMYIFLDGFDLGIGILFPFAHDKNMRDQMMNSIAPFWDGNETWLIMGGIMLFCGFPLAYSALLPAFYIPLILMLLALIFRGVAFEFRFKSETDIGQRIWNIAFALGSMVATFCQGVILGAFIDGIQVENGQFIGGPLDVFRPFSLFVGLALMGAYALLGACWLIKKTEGDLRRWAQHKARLFLPIFMAAFAVVSLWSLRVDPIVYRRWFGPDASLWVALIPILSFLFILRLGFLLYKREVRHEPFFLCLILFLLGFGGLGISLWPYVIPLKVTIWEASAPFNSQAFALVGIIVLLPIVLAYTAYNYYTFRGVVDEHEAYHE